MYESSGLGYFQQYFSYIMMVTFIAGGNQSIRRQPPTYRKSLTNFITMLVVIGTDCTDHTIMATSAPLIV